MRIKSRSARLVAISTGLVAAGCAAVTVRKVPSPTQYVQWTDEMQRQADHLEGLRFYLPRPFVNVFESFPIRTDVFFAHGLVSPDGQYVALLDISEDSEFHEYIAAKPEIKIPTEYVALPDALAENYETQGNLLDDAVANAITSEIAELAIPQENLAGRAEGTGESGEQETGSPTAPTEQPKTGIDQRRATNNNGAFAYQPLRGNFDLVYLPDFEEQFVVSSQAGLGNAQFEINLGQGWSLQGFNSLTDNSEINRRIFDLIDTSIKLAKAAASKALGIPLPEAPPPGMTFRTQADAEPDARQIPGVRVTLKIVVVHYAAKGLYPVIKPRELQERRMGQSEYYGFFDLFELFPKYRTATEFDPDAISSAQRAVANETRRFSVPRYPYQYVSFNTFRYAALEVLKPTSAGHPPFEHLYDRTGTEGDFGDTRRQEVIDLFVKYFGRPTGGDTPDDEEEGPSIAELVPWITGDHAACVPEGASTGPRYCVATNPAPELVATNLAVSIELRPADSATGPQVTLNQATSALRTRINAVISSMPNLGLEPITLTIRNQDTVTWLPEGPAASPATTTPPNPTPAPH